MTQNVNESRYRCLRCSEEFLVPHREIASNYERHRCDDGEFGAGKLIDALNYVSRGTIPPCTHKENWRPGQRSCLRCHAQMQQQARRKVREAREISFDLLEQSKVLICDHVCKGSRHHDICRMIGVFLRVYGPPEPPVAQKRASTEGMRKLSIWYKENEL